jgi:predicted dehydrogenase
MCRAIAELDAARVAAVFDQADDRADAFAGRYDATRHRSLDEILADAAVDVVYVALPHHLLAPTAERALEAGKHVLVEKPMALDAEAISSLERAAAQAKRVLAPVFELRAKTVFREARRLVRGGAIGHVDQVRIQTIIDKPGEYWSSAGWRARRADAGGGVVLMNAIHQLDLVRSITGIDVASVYCETATLTAEVEVEDAAAAVLRFENGAIGSVVAAAHSPGAEREERIQIDGSLGRIDLPHPSGGGEDVLRLYLRRPWDPFDAERWIDVDAGRGNAYVDYLLAFVAAIRGEGELPATADDAAAAVATVTAMYEASAAGTRVAVRR